ncbi:MAG TPA: DUF4230 domain-containing protein [Actinomycetes bacterium]|jgi:hypothetical protein|nr:DUF4230 domain-containing protein [Actinomycetes bacterium]
MSKRMGRQEPTRPLGPYDPWAETSRLGGPWPPQERQRPSRARIGIALLVVALLVLTVLGVGGFVGWRLWPSFPNPFASRSVDRSPPVVLKAIEDLHVYKAASGNFQILIDLEKDSKYLPSFVKGERTLFVAAGSVDAEVDFSGVDKGAIKVSEDRRSVSVTLPHARLTKARIDPDRSFVASRKRGLLDRLGSVLSDNPTSERELYQLATTKLGSAAVESGLVARAEANTRAMLVGMLRSLGFTNVTVTFQDPPT